MIVCDLDDTITSAPEVYQGFLSALQSAGTPVVVLSGCGDQDQAEAWDEKAQLLWDIGVNAYSRLVVVPDPVAENKATWLRQNEAQVFIDNNPTNVAAAQDAGIPVCLTAAPVLAKSVDDDTPTLMTAVVKASEEQRYTLGIAYPANRIDVAKGLDGKRDYANPEALERAAWGYLAKGRRIRFAQHFTGSEDEGVVVESYIYRGPDWATAGPDGTEQVIKSGDWMLGAVWGERVWPLVKSGLIANGWSVEGRAARRAASEETLAQLRS